MKASVPSLKSKLHRGRVLLRNYLNQYVMQRQKAEGYLP